MAARVGFTGWGLSFPASRGRVKGPCLGRQPIRRPCPLQGSDPPHPTLRRDHPHRGRPPGLSDRTRHHGNPRRTRPRAVGKARQTHQGCGSGPRSCSWPPTARASRLADAHREPPNLIGREFIQDQTDTTISFFEWVLAAAPIVLPMFLGLCIILIALNRPERRHITGADDYITEERAKLGRISRGERPTLIAFGSCRGLWV